MLDDIIGDKRPLTWLLQFWPVPLLSFISALAATSFCKKIALKFGIVDKPDQLVKTHKDSVAYLGGVGILVGLTVGVLTGLYCLYGSDDFRSSFVWLLGILGGASIACFVGLVDDIFDLRPRYKFLGQILAAVILIVVGVTPNLHLIARPLGIPMEADPEMSSASWIVQSSLAAGIVVFFVLGATNSLNLLDGLDGLCAGVTAIITLAMLLLSIHLATWGYSKSGDPARMIICLALVGGVCGFLPFNRHPAKIFMGDAGSMLLGYTAASLMLLFSEGVPRWWMASIVVFGLPILDTGVALVRRLLNKRPLFVSDRGHIYDQMIDRGIPLTRTVAICYLLAAGYAMVGLVMSQMRTWYAAGVYLTVIVVSAVVVWRKGFLKMEGLRGAVRNESTDQTA